MSDFRVRAYRKATRAYGSYANNGGNRHPRIVVQFSEEIFAAIQNLALKNRTSFAEQVRILCEIRLEEIGGAE